MRTMCIIAAIIATCAMSTARADLPRLDPSAAERPFHAQLAEATKLQHEGQCTRAYPTFLDLAKHKPNDPDVLWGLAECGVQVARIVPAVDQRRTMLREARNAYLSYRRAERRTKYRRERFVRAAACVKALSAFIGSGGPPPEDCAAPAPRETPAPRATPLVTETALADADEQPSPLPLVRLATATAVPTRRGAPVNSPKPTPTPVLIVAIDRFLNASPSPPPARVAPPSPAPSASPETDAANETDRAALRTATEAAANGNFTAAIAAVVEICTTRRDANACGHLVIWRTMAGDCHGALAAYETFIAGHEAVAAVHAAARDCAERHQDERTALRAQERYLAVARYADPSAYAALGTALRDLGNIEFRAGRDAAGRTAYARAERAYARYLALEHRPEHASEHRRVAALLVMIRDMLREPEDRVERTAAKRLARCKRLGIAQSEVIQVNGQWVEVMRVPTTGECQ